MTRCLFAQLTGLLVLGMFSSGCPNSLAPGCEPSEAPESMPSLELGWGAARFEALDDSALQLVRGSQGGIHLDLAVRARFLDGASPWAGRLTGHLDGAMAAQSEPSLRMRCNPVEDSLDAWAVRLVWDVEPEDLHGREVDLQAEVTDSSGVSLSVEVSDVLVEDPNLVEGR